MSGNTPGYELRGRIHQRTSKVMKEHYHEVIIKLALLTILMTTLITIISSDENSYSNTKRCVGT